MGLASNGNPQGSSGGGLSGVSADAPLSGSGTSGSHLVIANASGGAVGVVQLAGDFGGTATSPTVPGLATRALIRSVASTVTGAATLAANVHTPADATSAGFTLILPTGQAQGTVISVEKKDSTTNVITLSGNIRNTAAQTITLMLFHEAITLIADSTGSWWPYADHKTLSSLDGRYTQVAGDLGNTTASPQVLHLSHVTDASLPASGIAAVNPSSLTGSGAVPLAGLPTSTGNTDVSASHILLANDSRLSDSRAPNGSAGGDLAGTYPNPTVTGVGHLSGTLPGTVAVPATLITGSHTLPDGVLSTNVPLLASANAFTAQQSASVAASANYGIWSAGGGAFDGATTGFFVGSASGTHWASNGSATFAGNFTEFQTQGVSRFKVDYQGNVTLPALAVPIAPTIALAGAGAGSVTNGTHVIAITFGNANGETIVGASSSSVNVTDNTTNGRISVTAIPLGTNGVTSRRVYMSKTGTTTPLFLAATIGDNTTTSGTINIADASLTTASPSANTTNGSLTLGPTTIKQNSAGGYVWNSPSGISGTIFDLQVNGSSKANVTSGGVFTCTSTAILGGNVNIGGGSTVGNTAGAGPGFTVPANAGTNGWVLTNRTTASNVALILQGMASQSGDLIQWQNSTPTTLSGVRSDGLIYATRNTASNFSGLATAVKAGTPADADWASAPPDGTVIGDSTGSKIWIRLGGTWKSVGVA